MTRSRKRFALIGAAAVVCVATGGAAAPTTGTLLGRTFMGPGGAASTSAGLLVPRGRSQASGGLVVSGGAAPVAALQVNEKRFAYPGTLADSEEPYGDGSGDTYSAQDTPFAVAGTGIWVHDPSRPFDAVGGVFVGVRTLHTRIWYPVDWKEIDKDSQLTPITFLMPFEETSAPILKQGLIDRIFTPEQVVPGTTQEQIEEAVNHFLTSLTSTYRSEPVSTQGPFPVVLMSHGNLSLTWTFLDVVESLVSHGYIVVAMEHTGNVGGANIGADPLFLNLNTAVSGLLFFDKYLPTWEFFSNVTLGPLDPNFVGLMARQDLHLQERVNDLRAVMAELGRMNENGESPFHGTIDIDNIGVMGHSYGGGSVVFGLELIDELKAGVAVNPHPVVDFRPFMTADQLNALTVPGSLLFPPPGQELVIDAPTKPICYMLSEQDEERIDLLRAYFAAGVTDEEPALGDPQPLYRHRFENALGPVLLSVLENADHLSYTVFRDFFFPHIIRDTQPDFFNPGSEYTRVDRTIAHDILRTKTKAFFDLYLKGQRGATGPLVSQGSKQHGYLLMHRNVTPVVR